MFLLLALLTAPQAADFEVLTEGVGPLAVRQYALADRGHTRAMLTVQSDTTELGRTSRDPRVVLDLRIRHRATEGGWALRWRIARVEVSAASAEDDAEAQTVALDPAEGRPLARALRQVRGEGTLTPDGRLIDVVDHLPDALPAPPVDLAEGLVRFPDAPIGAGAVWQRRVRDDGPEGTLTVTERWALVEETPGGDLVVALDRRRALTPAAPDLPRATGQTTYELHIQPSQAVPLRAHGVAALTMVIFVDAEGVGFPMERSVTEAAKWDRPGRCASGASP